MPEAGATAEEAVEGGTPPWRPDPDCSSPWFACVVAVVVIILLALALVLPTRVTAAAAICFMFFMTCLSPRFYSRDGIGSGVLANVCAPHRRHRVVQGQGFNSRSRYKRCLHCLNGCVSSWQFMRGLWFSRRAVARAIGVCRPLHRGGSSVWMEKQTASLGAGIRKKCQAKGRYSRGLIGWHS